jgi:hypothetical protein
MNPEADSSQINDLESADEVPMTLPMNGQIRAISRGYAYLDRGLCTRIVPQVKLDVIATDSGPSVGQRVVGRSPFREDVAV